MIELLKPQIMVEPRSADPDSSRYIRSYLILRVLVGALGVVLPIMLVLCDGVGYNADPFPRMSLSAYYYSGVRELFVGTLGAIGVFLITYKAVERGLDNTFSILAGAAVIIVAVFPTGLPTHVVELTPLQEGLDEGVVEVLHFVAAGIFIVLLGVITVFFGVREGKRDPQQGKRSPTFWRNYHWSCAGVIGLALV